MKPASDGQVKAGAIPRAAPADAAAPTGPQGAAAPPASLKRIITLWPFVFYGLGVIIGAGVYVAIGEVIGRAGAAAPLSFLLAGIAALLTGLCYAELASRFPEAAGAAAYVRRAFGSKSLAAAVGVATTVAVAVSAASIALGAVAYVAAVLPLPTLPLVVVLVGVFTVIAALGVGLSVGLAALVGLIEIGGLLAAIVAGLSSARNFDLAAMVPTTFDGWQGVAAGAFIAFFAFIGFETMANLGEEVEHPRQTLPRGILIAVLTSLVLYVAVAVAAVLANGGRDLPLLSLFEGRSAGIFALLGAVAISNGVLVEIMMLARLFYGLARLGQLPAALGRVNPRTRTPLAATVVAGVLILAAAVALPFSQLLALSNAITLAIFVLVDLALWRVHRTTTAATATDGFFVAPRWVPLAGAVLSAGLIVAEVIR